MILRRLSELLRVPADEVEAVLRHDDKRARETVNRRRFMGAAAAMASAPFVPGTWVSVSAPEDILNNWTRMFGIPQRALGETDDQLRSRFASAVEAANERAIRAFRLSIERTFIEGRIEV